MKRHSHAIGHPHIDQLARDAIEDIGLAAISVQFHPNFSKEESK